MSSERILILDYSPDLVETPAIRRWLPMDAEVLALHITAAESFPDNLLEEDFTHVIHSGSALSITKTAPFTHKAVTIIRSFRDNGVAQIGVCYGHQLVCLALVGEHAVRSSPNGLEAGWNSVTFVNGAADALGVGRTETIWQHHFDEVTELPEGSELWATSPHSSIQAYINQTQHLFGTQFHPEFDKQAGNNIYLDDRDLLESHGYDVDEMVAKGPSIDAGKIFFDFFLRQIS